MYTLVLYFVDMYVFIILFRITNLYAYSVFTTKIFKLSTKKKKKDYKPNNTLQWLLPLTQLTAWCKLLVYTTSTSSTTTDCSSNFSNSR